MKVEIDHNPSEEKLKKLGVKSWPIWTKEVSEFPWSYDEKEVCYFLEGEVEVVADGETYKINRHDLVTFPEGMSCTWKIKKAVKKHYNFG